ncbi:MAG TPA: tetratricopeptide repeat protein [Azospirillaceae bacterium]|nr:tetratricopeptide repeat protein [Azospirillaceae bacterium]
MKIKALLLAGTLVAGWAPGLGAQDRDTAATPPPEQPQGEPQSEERGRFSQLVGGIARLIRDAREAAREDRNADSAALFERALAEAPWRRDELLREYADQLTYSGRARDALPLYREVLARPDLAEEERLRARRGEALALSWSRELQGALAAYRSLRKDRPDDLEAVLGEARVLTWLFRYDEARDAYRDLLERGLAPEEANRVGREIAETARAAARADRNAVAAGLFAQALRAAPSLRPGLLRDYADQLSYSDRAADAVPLYREALRSGALALEERLEARRGLARALAWSGAHGEALEAYDTLIAERPRDTDLRLGRAELLNWMGRGEQALAAYKEALDTRAEAGAGGDMAEILVRAARTAARSDRNAEAANLFRQALRVEPKLRPQVLREYADQLTYSNRASAAVPLYEEVLARPDLPPDEAAGIRRNLGLALTWAGRPKRALEVYDGLLAATPGDLEARRGRARALSALGSHDQAVAEYEAMLSAVGTGSEEAAAREALGGDMLAAARAAADAGRHAEAARLYERALSVVPQRRGEVLLDYADQLAFSDRAAEAVPLYGEALAQAPPGGTRRAELGRARALAWSSAHRPALTAYETRIAAAPEDIEARLGRAQVLSWMGRHRAAVAEYRRIADAEPDNEVAVRGLAEVRSWQGRQRSAQRLLRGRLAEEPGDQDARFLLAQSLWWMGRPDRALDRLDELLAERPGDERAGRLRREVLAARRPELAATAERSTQSDDLDITTLGAAQTVGFGDGRGRGGVQYRHVRYDPRGGARIGLHRPAARAEWRASNMLALTATAGLDAVRFRDPAFSDYERLTFDAYATLWPGDQVRLDAGARRTLFDNVRSLQRRVTATFWSGSVDWTPDSWLRTTLRGDYGDFSDGNRRAWLQGEVERKILEEPGLHLGGQVTAFRFSRRLDNGYFNPDRYLAGAATVRLAADLTERARLEAQGSAGLETSRPGGTKPIWSARAVLAYHLSDDVRLEAQAGHFSSRTASAGGFSRTTVGLGLRWRL